jgi:hypothetical protein
MTIPTTPYIAIAEIDELRKRMEYLTRAYLRRAGWEFTCDTPGSLWAWVKDVDGQRFVAHTQMAEEIQRSIDKMEMNRQHEPDWHEDGSCRVCGARVIDDDLRHQRA